MRKKEWVETLLGKREAIEKAIGFPLGDMLGCGHWGCVFRSTEPWVVKLSIDPTEGPIWSKIVGLVRDETWGDRGFVEVKSITRLLPDLKVGGRTRKVWVIVREAVEPVFREYSLRELGEKGRGTIMRTSRFTSEILGLPGPIGQFDRYVTQGSHEQKDFASGLVGLYKYRDLATMWHMLAEPRRSRLWGERMEFLKQRTHREAKRPVIAERIEQVLNYYFHGPHMAPLGESLSMLAVHEVYLRDVHNMNIGWHVGRSDDDWTRVVVFDPGHTPTGAEDIESVLLQNPREAL